MEGLETGLYIFLFEPKLGESSGVLTKEECAMGLEEAKRVAHERAVRGRLRPIDIQKQKE